MKEEQEIFEKMDEDLYMHELKDEDILGEGTSTHIFSNEDESDLSISNED